MTPDEYQSWITTHAAMVPEFGAWLSSLSAEARARAAVEWSRVMATTTAADALAVSRKFLDGELEHPARWGYHLLPKLVRDEAAKLASFRRRQARLEAVATSLGETFRCHHCLDTGWRLVLSHASLAEVMAGRIDLDAAEREAAEVRAAIAEQRRWERMPNLSRLRAYAVVCDCQEGEAVAAANERSGNRARRYDAFSCIDWGGALSDLTAEHFAAARDVAAKRRDGWATNRVSEFDDWNRGGNEY